MLCGWVIDQDIKEGVFFSNVFFEGIIKGIFMDVEGYYEFIVEEFGDSLSVSVIGYNVVCKFVLLDFVEQEINFCFGGFSLIFNEVVVIVGENLANVIVKGIIDNKLVICMSVWEFYVYESYVKIELDLENIDVELCNKKFFKFFEFIFENIDSILDEKFFLLIYINEVFFDVLYVKDVGQFKCIIKV